jgi:serine/threonine protein kinase/tetratricopeptide (TPR) repeat protein
MNVALKGACPVEETFLDLLAGRLTAEADAQLHRHVRGCEDCRLVLASLGQGVKEDDSQLSMASTLRSPRNENQSPPSMPPLASGERVGRFRIERWVGSGAMAAVYAARDPELGRSVALKLLRVGATEGDDAAGLRNRLVREAQAMARLAHPNVVTVFEVGTFADQVFVAMELVEQGTLSRWMAEKARPWREVLEIFLQAGRGLAAAHAAGLVHRDFKPDNVLLGADGRVRVTDFGLATARTESSPMGPSEVSRSTGSPSGRLTRTGALIGTPAYMAPEQMRGEPVDARADLFSFCSCLYEALYKQRAFLADSFVELRRKIESNEVSPAPPGSRVPSWVRRELLRGLRADPEERHATMGELWAALSKRRQRVTASRLLFALSACTLVASVPLALGSRSFARLPPTSATAAAPAPARRAVAVLALQSLSPHPETAWLSSALAEMMSSELASSRQLRVIPSENVAVAFKELGLAGQNAPEPRMLKKISPRVGADLFLIGSFAVLGDEKQLRVNIRLEDAANGEAIANVAETGEQAKLFELVSRLGMRLRRELGVVSPELDPTALASFPVNPEAARLFSEGLALSRSFEPMAATKSLEEAAQIAPNNPRILSALAQAYTDLGQEKRAREAARRAFEAADGLPRDERLSIEALYRRTQKELKRAVEIGRALVTIFPDDIEYRLRLGYDQSNASDWKDALATVESLRRMPLPAGTDPRIDLLESQVQRDHGDIGRSRELAARAATAGRAIRAWWLVAKGRYHEGIALRKLGDYRGATAALSEAEELFHQTGDRRFEAFAGSELAFLRAEQGDLTGAEERTEAALGVFRELGNRKGEAAALLNLSIIHGRQHQFVQAVKRIDDAISIYREWGDRRSVSVGLYNRGNILMEQGDVDSARRSYEESLSGYRALGLKDREAWPLSALADIALIQGDLAAAEKLFRDAKELQPPGEKVQTFWSVLGLARVAFEEERWEDALTLAKQASDVYRERGLEHDAAMAEALRARALLGLGKRDEALGALKQAQALVTHGKSAMEPGILIAESALVAATDSRGLDEMRGKLQELLDHARGAGAVADELDLRLALAELELRADAHLACNQLTALVADARAHGFLLTARKAEAMLKQRPKEDCPGNNPLALSYRK